jgi:hypothetical protein
MRVTFPTEELKEALNGDPEFRIAARYWNGAIEFRVDTEPTVVTLEEGHVTSVSHDLPASLADVTGPGPVVIAAPAEDWAQLLEHQPRPFYQDYHSATAHHGFRMDGDVETLWAYYAAVRRSADILRDVAVVEED